MNYTSEKFTNQRCKLLSEITNFFHVVRLIFIKKNLPLPGVEPGPHI